MNSKFIILLFVELYCASNCFATASSECAATVSAFPPDPKTRCCGVDEGSTSTKLIRGPVTEIDQYPWLALIEYAQGDKLKTLCGGTLISGKYVLTAAYCVIGIRIPDITPKNIILGEYDVSNEGRDCVETPGTGMDCSDGALRIAIEKIVPHPSYNSKHITRENDIALIRMTENAPYTEFIRPICLPASDVTLKKDLNYFEFAGWGTSNGPSSVKVQVRLPFVPLEKCQLVYSKMFKTNNVTLWKGQLCAGGEKGKDSCKGDGGMPLMYEDLGIYSVIGLVSFGAVACGTEDVPSVYTNVYEYKSWITSNIEA